MAAVVTRELTVVYAGLTLGGSSDYLLDGPYSLDVGHEDFTFRARVIVAGNAASGTSGDTTFASACAALEAAFRTNKSTLTVAFNAATHVSFVDGSTAYGVTASWSKPGTPAGEDQGADTGRSRLYDVTVRGKIPEDLSGRSGLREGFSWSVAYSPSRRRTLTVSGVYTMQGSTGSFQQYLSSIGARVAAVQTLLTSATGGGGAGTWELVEERAEPDANDDETRFSRTYEERHYSQSVGALDDADVVRSELRVERDRAYPGDTGSDVRRLQNVTATWSGWITLGSVAIASGDRVDLRGKWESKILPWIVAVVRDTVGSGPLALVSNRPAFDYEENRITATLSFVHAGGGSVLSRRVTTVDTLDEAVTFAKFWKQVGDAAGYAPPKARTLKAPVTIRRSIETAEEVLGSVPPPAGVGATGGSAGFLGGFGIGQQLSYSSGDEPARGTGATEAGSGTTPGDGAAGNALPAGPRWALLSTSRRSTELLRGEPGYTFTTTELVVTRTFEYVDEEPAGSSGGGGGAGGGDPLRSRTRSQAGSA